MAHFVDYFPVPNKIEQLRDQKQALSRFRAENDQISMCDTLKIIAHYLLAKCIIQ